MVVTLSLFAVLDIRYADAIHCSLPCGYGSQSKECWNRL